MYHQNSPYSGYQAVPPSMRPPTHPPPPLSIPGHPQHQYTQYSLNSSPAGNMQMRQQQVLPPPSPSESSDRAGQEEEYFNMPGPKPTSHVWGGYVWALEVVQHPQRARMCGFGDKDRRPISPPPCIRLVILNPSNNEELDYYNSDIDLTHLVLTVDIWDLGSSREMNLVKQSNASPCISSAATGAYPTTAVVAPPAHDQPKPYDVGNIPGYAQQYTSPNTPNSGASYYPPSGQGYPPRPYMNGQSGQPSQYQNGSPAYPRQTYPYPDGRFSTSQPQTPQTQYPSQLPPINAMTGGMEHNYVHSPPATTQLYTRNLIGSLCASAFRLKDENEKWGIWFVLQDLSVRTEGWFRLKMSFFNISQAIQKQIAEATNSQSLPNAPSDKATAPCLASTFSNPFRVYSAKKFPGVVESTPLSKAFANQGIKIPIRKDTGGKRGRDDSEDDGSGGDD